MATTTATGIGLSATSQSIVTALVAAEKQPKQNQIDTQTTNASTTLSSISIIKSALDTYRTAIAKLNTATSFNSLTTTSSDEKIAKATIDATATSGTYALSVTQLATASRVTSAVFTGGASAVVNSGTDAQTLTISQGGNDYDVTIAAGATLQETRDAINTQLKTQGITANVLTGADGARLVISSSTTGAGTDLAVSGIESLSQGTTSVSGVNAKYSVDGNEIESKSNTVTGALSGVTLNLVAKGDTTIKVANDTATLKTSAQSFVTAYNTLMSAINTQTKVTPTTTTDGSSITAGALTGDATMRRLVASVRTELVGGSGSSSSTLSSLSQLGITTDRNTGLLSLDDTKWDKAVTTYGSTEITNLFTGTNGVLKRMTTATDSYASSSGILVARQTALSNTLDSLKDAQTALDRRITSLQATLTAKYAASDTLVAQLNATSKSIMTTLNALNKTSDE